MLGTVEALHAAVVAHSVVHHRHAKVTEQAVCAAVAEELGQHLPRVGLGVFLEKVVLAPVAGDLELRAEAQRRTGLPRLGDGLPDALQIAREVHRPLVQVARGNHSDGGHRACG